MTAVQFWCVATVNGQTAEWLSLLEVGANGVHLGVSRSGAWLVGDATDCIPVGSTSAGVRLLPLLEMEPGSTHRAITDSLRDHDVSVDGGPNLPILVAIMAALAGRSQYWADLALTWLGVVEPTPDVLAALEAVVNERWASQRLRHGAQKILRRSKASTGD